VPAFAGDTADPVRDYVRRVQDHVDSLADGPLPQPPDMAYAAAAEAGVLRLAVARLIDRCRRAEGGRR
jgi:hypothetical protein